MFDSVGRRTATLFLVITALHVAKSALSRSCPAVFSPSNLNGASTQCIKSLQTELNKVPGVTKLNVDGLFGQSTVAAVRQLQTINNIQVDGIVGPDTRQALDRATAAGQPPSPTSAPPRQALVVQTQIRLQVYIPTKLVDSFINVLLPYGIRWLAGDGRDATSSRGASSRVYLSATIKTQGTNLVSLSADPVRFGESKGYNDGQVNNLGESAIGISIDLPGAELYVRCKVNLPRWACGELKSGEQPAQVRTQTATNDKARVTAQTTSFSSGEVEFFVDAREPLDLQGDNSFIPKISAQITAKISVPSNGSLNVQISGAHDQFPNYEMYVFDQSVYNFDVLTQGNGKGPFSLIASKQDVNVNSTITSSK